ncbi:helix-turn-helix domain-containing protein [Roseomonas stagni]|uniref:Helix-turn-helix domain-containing protein n=1 Tax=Falsiroseomonas algicola TaxID=2716930 RepID=A0A6M1LSH7_9PROT|nr:helix-turn-helix domain-containing protein [Falsiroseomonas algicola]NGM23406.1 helix-turn-helix domain-containing protein [Falsiroseomonas algicola]
MGTPAKPIRAFARGLDLLAALNRHGGATALTLARETGIPRATVYRLIETLEREGYVARSPSDERWVLRLKVRGLSDGFEDEEWISAVAAPALYRLTARIGWPCDLCTLEGTAMVIRETTHRVARFSIDRGMIGRALPVLPSSVGQAWLAFSGRAERETLIGLLAASDRAEDAPARRGASLARSLALVRRRGYALRPGGTAPWRHTGSLALPVRHHGVVLGCVNTVWMARAVSTEEGVRQCLEPLRGVVAEIEAALEKTPPPA